MTFTKTFPNTPTKFTSASIYVPKALIKSHENYTGAAGRDWITRVPQLAADFLNRWQLELVGPGRHGVVSLVLPVTQADGTPAALKLQPLDEDSVGASAALRAWNGDGAVQLLDEDPETGTQLLERLNATKPLSAVPDDIAATQTLAELLARLSALPAPTGLRRLADIAAAMLDQVPQAVPALADHTDRLLVQRCASAVAELIDEPGDRLLHWDLHYDNILAGEREPWLAIDPQPLAGDPCFELLPALDNRWDEIVASGDVTRAVHRRFDLMIEVVGLDRQRAIGWTLGRVLQNALWEIEDGEHKISLPQVAVATALFSRMNG